MSTIESIYWFNNDQDVYTSSAPLLMAPVTIVDSRSRASHSNSAANFIHRRHPARSPPRNRRTPRTRAVAPISDAGHPFDSLPWISQMNNASDPSIFDIADLSQLPDGGESIGPVRRRKTSLRSSPLRRPSSSSASSSLSDDDAPPITLPPHFLERCTTPPPRLPRNDYSEIRFHNLMPQI